jgi:glutaredoxin 3
MADAGTESTEAKRVTAEVMMYSTAMCPYCNFAERLLRAKGVSDIAKVRVDLEPARRAEMMSKTGRRTVPQIYIGTFHVGGYEDLVALDRAGKLDPMLAPEPS